MNLMSDLQAAREQRALFKKQTTMWLFDLLLVAVRVIYSAAAAGNVQCKEGVKQLEILWKSKPSSN